MWLLKWFVVAKEKYDAYMGTEIVVSWSAHLAPIHLTTVWNDRVRTFVTICCRCKLDAACLTPVWNLLSHHLSY